MAELQKSHVRQHYIPQFILKNFCYNQSKENVFFFKVGENKPSSEFVSNVFMEKHLYSKPENPVEIEESLAKFERDIAPIFKKFTHEAEITLTFTEYNRLRIFLSLLAFRAVNTRDQFDNMSDRSKAMYNNNRDSIDMKDLWLKNVHLLSRHRTIDEVLEDKEVSSPLKLFICQEFYDFYMCLLERRGDVDFHISDCYPVVMNGESELNGKTINLPIYYFYPISDSRIIILVTEHIKYVPKRIAHFDIDKILKRPKNLPDGMPMLFRPEKIYYSDVEWINEMIIKNAKVGTVVKDLDRCSSHFIRFYKIFHHHQYQ